MGLDGAFGEHIRFALEVAVIVHNLQGTQQIVGRIIGKCQPVATAVDNTIFFHEAVI